MNSIRRYLFRTLALSLALITVLSVTATYLITNHELEEILDAQLSLTAREIMSFLPDQPTPQDYQRLAERLDQGDASAQLYPASGITSQTSAHHPTAHLYHHEERKLTIGLWDNQARPLVIGPRWHSDDESIAAPQSEGFAWIEYQGKRWRSFTVFDAQSDLWLRLGIEHHFLEEIVERVSLNHLWPMLLLLPLTLVMMLYLIRRGLDPIRQLSRQVHDRNADDLGRIELPVPKELHDLRSALNEFIARLDKTLEGERRFTADAAHELRTPLAAMKIHLDNAEAGERDALPKAQRGIARLQRVVDQLLTLARVDRKQFADWQHLDLRPLLFELVAESWPLAEARQQQLYMHDIPSVYIDGNAVELGILIRNLLDNALRYTPDGGRIDVALHQDSSSTTLTIQDSGPGIPEDQLATVTERFRRASDQSTTGSGLGLSIAMALAARHGAILSLTNADRGGLIVRLIWPSTQMSSDTQPRTP